MRFTDANGHTTSSRYDTAGNLITQTHADDSLEHHRYDAFGNRLESWTQTGSTPSDPRYNITRFTWDGAGRLSTTTHAGADVRIVGQNAGGFVTERIDDSRVASLTTFAAGEELKGPGSHGATLSRWDSVRHEKKKAESLAC